MLLSFYGICIAIEFVVCLKSLFPSEGQVFLGDYNEVMALG